MLTCDGGSAAGGRLSRLCTAPSLPTAPSLSCSAARGGGLTSSGLTTEGTAAVPGRICSVPSLPGRSCSFDPAVHLSCMRPRSVAEDPPVAEGTPLRNRVCAPGGLSLGGGLSMGSVSCASVRKTANHDSAAAAEAAAPVAHAGGQDVAGDALAAGKDAAGSAAGTHVSAAAPTATTGAGHITVAGAAATPVAVPGVAGTEAAGTGTGTAPAVGTASAAGTGSEDVLRAAAAADKQGVDRTERLVCTAPTLSLPSGLSCVGSRTEGTAAIEVRSKMQSMGPDCRCWRRVPSHVPWRRGPLPMRPHGRRCVGRR